MNLICKNHIRKSSLRLGNMLDSYAPLRHFGIFPISHKPRETKNARPRDCGGAWTRRKMKPEEESACNGGD